MLVQIHFVHYSSLHARRNVPRHEVVYQLMQTGLTAQMLRPGAHPVPRVPPADPDFSPMLVGHEPVVRLLLLSAADITRNCLPDHRISPNSAERNRFLYFIVRRGKTVSELRNESGLGPKPEGREACPETEHSLSKLIDCKNRVSTALNSRSESQLAAPYCLGAK